jgi:short-subunit dehydrogenase
LGGPFAEHDPDRVVQMVRTNVESTMVLAHAVLCPMMGRRRGALLIVSSMAGHQPMPYFGAYAATKAALTSFAEMLSGEVAGHGITVTALCPGGVRTEFSEVGGLDQFDRKMPEAVKINADECAIAALRGLDTGRRIVMPRAAVRALAFTGTHLPRAVWLPLCKKMMSS